jgi:hypothetical protein
MSSSGTLNRIELDAGIAPQFVDIRPEPRAFVFLNSKKNPVDVACSGRLMTVPARDVIGPNADTDSEGRKIPGSCVFADMFKFNAETGEDELIFDAKFAARLILGIEPGAGGRAVATSRYAQGGLSMIPRHAAPEVWKAAAESGETRAFAVEVDNARNVILAYDEINRKRKADGGEAIGGGREYQRARFLIEKAEELEKKEAESRVSPYQEDGIDAEIELMSIVRAKAMELTEKAAAGKTIDKKALFEEMLNDPQLRIWSQKEWSIRRRGHLPIQKEMLEVAAAGGLGVVEAGLEDEREVSR